MAALVRQKGGRAVDESRFRSDLPRWIPCLINELVTSGPLRSLRGQTVRVPCRPNQALPRCLWIARHVRVASQPAVVDSGGVKQVSITMRPGGKGSTEA
jgi:hypothetical protein